MYVRLVKSGRNRGGHMYIKIKVKAGMTKESVEKISEDHFDISVKEPAKRNLANKRILEIMGKLYPNRLVRIINGHNSPSKLLSISE